ncbi:MAG: hypothetical protein GXP08_02655 [Gammaproteobacteria bacterium]|nr:hypothetical protein [Gammaproteobacteria bacterium]
MSESLNNINNIASFAGMEFSTFKLQKGASEKKMLEAAKNMEQAFLSKEKGFLGHGVLKGHDDFYVDIVFATSKEKAEELCGKWMQNEFALQYLNFIDPESVNMRFWKRIK